jgi:hypothetical protein
MLEPYTPKFEEALHRPSCPLTTLEAVATKRMSLGHMSIQWNQTGLNPIRGEFLCGKCVLYGMLQLQWRSQEGLDNQ